MKDLVALYVTTRMRRESSEGKELTVIPCLKHPTPPPLGCRFRISLMTSRILLRQKSDVNAEALT